MVEPKPVRTQKRFWIWAMIAILAVAIVYLALGSPTGAEDERAPAPASQEAY